jgi:hypothetical protein
VHAGLLGSRDRRTEGEGHEWECECLRLVLDGIHFGAKGTSRQHNPSVQWF